MNTARETPPARRVAAVGHWLTLGRSTGSRHRDVQGGTTRAAVPDAASLVAFGQHGDDQLP